jgi:hypothetical protein
MAMREPIRLVGGALLGALLAFAAIAHATAPQGRYTISGGTVYDTKTKLTWQQTVSGTYVWGSAVTSGSPLNYCGSLVLNGSGWRLPTMQELLTIVDYSASSPSIDATAFPSTPVTGFWTATVQQGDGGQWVVNFSDGSINWVYTTGSKGNSSLYVRCVR